MPAPALGIPAAVVFIYQNLKRLKVVLEKMWRFFKGFRTGKRGFLGIPWKSLFSLVFIKSVTAMLAPVVLSILLYLGLNAVTIVGLVTTLNVVLSFVINHFLKIPLEVQQLLGLAKVDIAINIIMGAYTAKFAVMGFNKMSKGALKRWHF